MQTTINNLATQKANRYNTLAADYLANKKQFVPMYEVSYYPDVEDSDFEISAYKHLTEAQCAQIKAALAECQADEIPLWEYYCEKQVPDYLEIDNPYYTLPNGVDFETPYIEIRIKVAVFYDGIEAAPDVKDGYIALTYDEYATLLSWQMRNRYANYGDLYQNEPELFSIINDKILHYWCDRSGGVSISPLSTPIFAIDLVEPKEDALVILGEPSVESVIYYNSSAELSELVGVAIEERVLSIHYNSVGKGGSDFKLYGLYDIDAIALQQMLGAQDYAGIIAHLKENYGHANGVNMLQQLLDEQGVKYTTKENE